MNKPALLVIDVQNDFCPGGALAVPNGDKIIPLVNRLIKGFYDMNLPIVATQDWHPVGHGSFASTHKADVFTFGELSGVQQILWPDHCVQNTKGAEFHADLLDVPTVVCKGMDPTVDSYSGFFDNCGKNVSGLNDILKKEGVNEVYIVGLATDFCVMFTALDAVKLGYKTTVILEACRAVNLNGSEEAAINTMTEAGVELINTQNALMRI